MKRVPFVIVPIVAALLIGIVVYMICMATSATERAVKECTPLVEAIKAEAEATAHAPKSIMKYGAEEYDGKLYYGEYRIIYAEEGKRFVLAVVIDDYNIVRYDSSKGCWDEE